MLLTFVLRRKTSHGTTESSERLEKPKDSVTDSVVVIRILVVLHIENTFVL